MTDALIIPEKTQSAETDSDPIPDSQTNTQKNTLEAIERKRFMSDFLLYLKESHFEDGFENQADVYLRKILKSDSHAPFASAWIKSFYLKHEDNPFIIERILRVLSHFEVAEVSPIGPILAIKALSHTDLAIKEMGIQAFENWDDKEYIPLLELTDCHNDDLNDYLLNVIQYLKGL